MSEKLHSLLEALKTLFLNLWLSVSSVDYYCRVYKSYKGYGIKYIFTLSFISMVVCCFNSLFYLINIEKYFLTNQINKYTLPIEYILQQLPVLHYDGQKIKVEEELPFYLNDIEGRKLVAIDLDNKLNYAAREKIPIILTSNNIIISLQESLSKSSNKYTFSYKTLFGDEPKVFSQDELKEYFSNTLKYYIKIYIYIVTPFLIAIHFGGILLYNGVIVFLLYFITNFFGPKMSLETSIRLVMFSSGVWVLMQPLLIPFFPMLSGLVRLIQLWSSLLLTLAIVKVRNNAIQL